MNTVLITLVIVTLCIVIIIQYANIVKLNRKVNDINEEKIKAEVQRHDIVKIAKSLLKPLVATEAAGNLPEDRLPFAIHKQIASNIGTLEDGLSSIRLRLKEGKVLIYINGLINPTKETVVLNNISQLTHEHRTLINVFLNKVEGSDLDAPTIPLTPQKITHILTYNTNPFKN